MLIIVGISLVVSCLLYFIVRLKSNNLLVPFLVSAIITDAILIAYVYMVGEVDIDPLSLIENFRIIFLCFVGSMLAEFIYLVKLELSSMDSQQS
jgi:hypothetical protein